MLTWGPYPTAYESRVGYALLLVLARSLYLSEGFIQAGRIAAEKLGQLSLCMTYYINADAPNLYQGQLGSYMVMPAGCEQHVF